MTDKDQYLIGYALLDEVIEEHGDSMSPEEKEAIVKAKGVLARFYANETLYEINDMRVSGFNVVKESFSDKIIERIKAYNKSAEDGLDECIKQQTQKE